VARYRILFIDDEPSVLKALGDYFAQLGHEVFRAESGKKGLGEYGRVSPDVTVLDLHMPDMSGLDVLRELRKQDAMVLMLTGHGEIETAVQAMKLGAENFLTKPVDLQHLVAAVEKAAEKVVLRRENVELRSRLKPSFRRRALRYAGFAILVAASLMLGQLIGGGEDTRPQAPIPILPRGADSLPAPVTDTTFRPPLAPPQQGTTRR
jgi:DNA-binding response OmpR family regulator